MECRFDFYREEYRLVEPENIDELEVKSALETYLSGFMHDEEPGDYDNLLREQEGYIQEYIESLGEFDNSVLIGNINYYLKKLNLRMGEFEQLIGVSAGYISRTTKEKSVKKLSIDIVWKIVKLFGVDIRSLLEVDLMIPNSNAEMISKFLSKLCIQTKQNDITWENHGGGMCYLDEAMRSIGLFSEEEDGTIVYHCNDQMNPNHKFVLADDIYTCSPVVDGKEFAMIGFGISGRMILIIWTSFFLRHMSMIKTKGILLKKHFIPVMIDLGLYQQEGEI